MAAADTYKVGSGLPIYGGIATPSAALTLGAFDSVTFVNTSDGAPWSAQNGKVLVVNLHGSSGQNTSNGRQYKAKVSGSLAIDTYTEFAFNLVAAYMTINGVGTYYVTMGDTDQYGLTSGGYRRESNHCGFKFADGKFHLITERRIDAMVAFSDANLSIYDLQRRVIAGGSMGGWGAISYGLRRGSKFAAVYADRPRWKGRNGSGQLAIPIWVDEASTIDNSGLLLATEDGGGSFSDYMDMITYVQNTANAIPWVGFCLGRNDGFASFQGLIDAVAALRAGKRGFACYWNDGDHSSGSQMAKITDSYSYGTFKRGEGYPLYTSHSLDQNPSVDLIGGINIGLTHRNVVETASGWSCEVTSIAGACTVQAEPISKVYTTVVSKKTVTIPAANSWVTLSFP